MHYCPSGSELSCQIFKHCSWNNLLSAIFCYFIYFSTCEITKDWTFSANISTGHGCKINKQLMTTFWAPFCFCVAKTANRSQINQQCYSKCSKCRPSAFTQARNLRLQIASCGNLSQIFTSADFSSWVSFGYGFIYKTEWHSCDVVVKLVSWYSVVFSICRQDFNW